MNPTGGSTVPQTPKPPDAARRSVLRALRPFVRAGCVAAALVHPLASILSRRIGIADLISHFQEPALAVTLLALGVCAFGNRRLACALAALAIWQVVPLLRYSGANPVQPDPARSERFRLLVANVLWLNDQHDDLARLIRLERPDAVCLTEYSTDWRDGLAEIRAEFPYRMEAPAHATGLALWFRERPRSLDPAVTPTSDGWPYLHATFDFAGETRALWLIHPRPPQLRPAFRGGFHELEAIGAEVGVAGGSRIVVGDLNSSDGSGHFRDFLRTTGLRDSRLGFGRQGSWPSDWPYRLAIDHAFVSDDLAVVSRRLGPFVGSDHFPLIVDLAPAAATNSATQPSHASASP